MQNTHIRNQYHLYWKQVIGNRLYAIDNEFFSKLCNLLATYRQLSIAQSRPFIVYCLLPIAYCLMPISQVNAQNQTYKRVFDEFYDDRLVHFGFLFGGSNTFLDLRTSPYFVSPDDSTINVSSPGNFEFHVGLLAKFKLARRLELRVAPAITLTGRQIEYRFVTTSTKTDERNSTWFELPITLKYLSQRRFNSRMYVFGGVKVSFETGNRKIGAVQGQLDTYSTDFALEYGVGFEQFLQYTKFTPEIRFSHGLVNLFVPPSAKSTSPYSKVLDGFFTHSVSFYFYFE